MSSGRNGFVPPQSPDLAVIENAIAYLKSEVNKLQSQTLEELQRNVLKVWENMGEKFFATLFASLPNRWRECVENDGGWTRY